MRLVLASASPARTATLTSAGIAHEVQVSGVDEDAALAASHSRRGRLGPADDALVLARAKAEDVAARLSAPHAAHPVLVLGCDSLLELDGTTHGKPSDAHQAADRWRLMRGRSGTLHTGHWLIDLRTGLGTGATSSTVVHFANLTDAEIDAYVRTEEPLRVAGAFTIDGLGGPFVTGIDGDHHGVVGLSLPVLRDLLATVDITVPDLWAPAPEPAGGDAGFTALRTPRLVIRRFRAEDAEALAGYRTDPDVARYQTWDTPYPLDRARRLLERLAELDPDTPGQWYNLAITLGDEVIGDVAVHSDVDDPRNARIGFSLARHAQGQGYATEAVSAVLEYLFTTRGKHRVSACCDARNTASAALLERVGMTREGRLRQATWVKGEWTDDVLHAVLADEWPSARTAQTSGVPL